MNIYLLPVCYPDEFPIILKKAATSFQDAQDRFAKSIIEAMDWDLDMSLNELREYAEKKGCLIGEISDIEDF